MLIIWPLSTSLGPLVALVIINGAANGGFFATMPTVAVSIWGSAQVSVAMGMIVTGWAGGYLMVISPYFVTFPLPFLTFVPMFWRRCIPTFR